MCISYFLRFFSPVLFSVLSWLPVEAQKIKSIISEGGTTVHFDTLGSPIKYTEFNLNPERSRTYIHSTEYDSLKRVVSVTVFRDSIPLSKVVNVYSGKRRVRQEYFEATKFGTQKTDAFYSYNSLDSVSETRVMSGKDTIRIVSKNYNEHGKLVSEIQNDLKYNNITYKEYSYGDGYRMIYTVSLSGKDTSDYNCTKTWMNKRGEIVKQEKWQQYDASIIVDRTDDLEENLEDAQTVSIGQEEYRMGKKGYVSTCEYEYEYDEFGNWTKTHYCYYPHITGTIERKLNYY